MNKVCVLWVSFLLLGQFCIAGENQFLVYFNTKPNAQTDLQQPDLLFSQKSLQRKQTLNIAITEEDCPVYTPFLDSLRNKGAVVRSSSKWLNAAYISFDESQISVIESLSFVKSVTKPLLSSSGSVLKKVQLDEVQEMVDPTLDLMEIRTVQSWGFLGQNIEIAVFDGGFYGYENLNAEMKLGEIYNFVDLEKTAVQGLQEHGTNALSLIAGNKSGYFTGIAPKATFHLFVTEDEKGEHVGEEFNWLVAAEKVDSIGVEVVSSSLGYSNFDVSSFDHVYADYNTQKAIVSFAAHKLYEKGVLVVNSVGNENGSAWKYEVFPADDEHVISAGGIKFDKSIASFSSLGYPETGIIKPDVVCQGQNVPLLDSQGIIKHSNGTSFSCPQIAGFLVLVKQAFPNLSNDEIKTLLYKCADRNANPDLTFGYGIPSVKKFFELADPNYLPNFSSLKISNPVSKGNTRVFVPTDLLNEQAIIYVYSNTGGFVKQLSALLSERITSLDLGLEDQTGLYLVEIRTSKSNTVLKLISY